MKKTTTLFLGLCCTVLSWGQTTIYQADFSTVGGFMHSTTSPPAPIGTFDGGNYTIGYLMPPSTDVTTNSFRSDGTKLVSADFGGEAGFVADLIDISAVSNITITGIGSTLGANDFNDSGEFFRWGYSLDGALAFTDEFTITSGTSLNTPVSFENIDVSGATSLALVFDFNMDDDGTGFEITSIEVTSNPAMPIELAHFQAKRVDQSVALTWQTSSEIDNHYMAIERSQDGREFQEIGRVQGAGTTNIPQNYSLIDQSPANGINYYRLRQVDFDGKTDYSEVVSVDFKGANSELTVRPTEASTWVTLELSAGFPENGNLQVFDLNGRLLYQQEVAAGAPTMDLDVRNFAAGQYVVRLIAGSRVETQRFFKK
ncbi:MAG: T9SS type A sorting domain-containing protein [Bacteroidota bacterium]